MHYQRLMKDGDVGPVGRVKRASARTCSVDGCDVRSRAGGMCNKHHKRFKAHGDPNVRLGRGGRQVGVRPPCKLDDCDQFAHSLSLCEKHYGRLRRQGDPRITKGRGPGDAEGWIDGIDGYRKVYVPGRGRLREHRVVMERALGRQLLRTESVHHINGIRHDNRLQNLELWSSSQPPGQRVEDKVAWAIELLRLYRPEALAGE